MSLQPPSVALVLVLALTGALSAQQPALGPVGASERNPFYELFYVAIPETADVIPQSSSAVDVQVAYSNIFERGRGDALTQDFDMERLTTTVALRHALSPRWEVGGRISVQSSWGGFLDPLIQGLHNALGVPNGDREKEPNGAYGLRLQEKGGRTLWDVPARVLAPEDLQLFAKWQLLDAANSAVSVRGTVELPTGAEGTGTGRVDAALDVIGRRSWTHWHVYGLLGANTINAPDWARPWTHSAALYTMAGAERHLGGLALLAQVSGSTPYLGGTGSDELDAAPTLLVLGLAGRRTDWQWSVSFVEDVPPNGPSVDFTVHVQFSRTWP